MISDAAALEMVWDVLNVTVCILVFLAVSWSLHEKLDDYTPGERIGYGILAAGCVLRIGPIATKPSPFDGWSTFLMGIGILVFVLGRHFRHRYANWVASRQAEEMLKARGLLPRKDK